MLNVKSFFCYKLIISIIVDFYAKGGFFISFNTKFIPLTKPYSHKIKNITFVVSSFGNQNISACAEDTLFDMLQHKISNKNQ